jgi:hypothetical protein
METICHQDGQRYPRTRDVLSFLGSHGIIVGQTFQPEDKTAARWCPREKYACQLRLKDRPAILSVPSNGFDGHWHYTFWDGRFVRDPSPDEPEKGHLEDYDVYEIWPLTYVDERRRRRSPTEAES